MDQIPVSQQLYKVAWNSHPKAIKIKCLYFQNFKDRILREGWNASLPTGKVSRWQACLSSFFAASFRKKKRVVTARPMK